MPAGSRARNSGRAAAGARALACGGRAGTGSRDGGRQVVAVAAHLRALISLSAPSLFAQRLMWVLEYPRNHKSKYLVLPRQHQY